MKGVVRASSQQMQGANINNKYLFLAIFIEASFKTLVFGLCSNHFNWKFLDLIFNVRRAVAREEPRV
jgi:hypothetical protein